MQQVQDALVWLAVVCLFAYTAAAIGYALFKFGWTWRPTRSLRRPVTIGRSCQQDEIRGAFTSGYTPDLADRRLHPIRRRASTRAAAKSSTWCRATQKHVEI